MTEEWVVDAAPSLVSDAHFNADGLIPCIAQDVSTKDVLMMAWMDREALLRTLREGRMTYYSRSRSEYWRKGDTSGHIQVARHLRLDCDGDVLLAEVEQTGPACHTGAATCFDADHSHG
jgi:phosphoribosyl-AMP cyclohydrolase